MATMKFFHHDSEFETYAAGDFIFRSKELGKVMYAVKTGEVDIQYNGVVLETVGEGGIFGEMALIDTGTRSADAVAKTDCEIVPIDEKRFTFLVRQTPFFALHVMRILADRLRHTTAATHSP